MNPALRLQRALQGWTLLGLLGFALLPWYFLQDMPLLQALLHQLGMLPAGYEREPPFELLAPPAAIDPFSILENDEPEAN